jgi:hypothetical protein
VASLVAACGSHMLARRRVPQNLRRSERNGDDGLHRR